MSSTDGAHLGHAVRQATGAHSDTKAGTQEMGQGLVCASGLCTPSEPKLSLPPRSAGPATSVFDTRSCGKVRSHGWMQSVYGDEAVHILTNAGPGWMNASQEKRSHVQGQQRKPTR